MYKIAVHIEGMERRKKSTGLLHIIAGFFLVLIAADYYQQTRYSSFLPVLPVYMVAVISLAYGFMRKRIDPLARYNHWVRMAQFITFAILAITIVDLVNNLKITGLAFWAVALLFLMFTEHKLFHDTVLHIKKEGIFVPGYFKSHLMPWSIIAAVVLRTDYLTIIRTNEKYVQLELINNMEQHEIEEINQFCQKQIKLQPQVVAI